MHNAETDCYCPRMYMRMASITTSAPKHGGEGTVPGGGQPRDSRPEEQHLDEHSQEPRQRHRRPRSDKHAPYHCGEERRTEAYIPDRSASGLETPKAYSDQGGQLQREVHGQVHTLDQLQHGNGLARFRWAGFWRA